MKLALSYFSTRTPTFAVVSERPAPTMQMVTRASIVEVFGAELYGQRRF